MLTGPDGVKYIIPKVNNILSPRHHPRRLNHIMLKLVTADEKKAVIAEFHRALFHEETEGATRSPTSGDGHVGLYRFDLFVCGA